MSRVYNFSAGPSMLPEPVLHRAADEIFDYGVSGQSVMEMSHRSKVFDGIMKETQALLRELYDVPENYKILFIQGGASLQFAAIPLNLMNKNKKADYVLTGQFSSKSFTEACKYGDAKVIASSKDKNFSYIPEFSEDDVRSDADYVHICFNNTIYGTRFSYIPSTGNVPLVADVSSFFLSEPLDISRFGMIYGGAQKNAAPAGLTIVIIREDLIGNARQETPSVTDYEKVADAGSMYNTPPCWNIYICKLVLEWIKEEGGLKEMKRRNAKKAQLLYDYIDSTDFYVNNVKKSDRSLMNVTFTAKKDELNTAFVKEAEKAGLVNLNGHRSVGGMRASIYNAMPTDGVKKLIDFMKEFEARHTEREVIL